MKPLETGDPTSLGEGRYRLVGRLGQGGMGVVYLGRSQSGRAVAVKVQVTFDTYQHNRNPFIDHPEWVDSIW
ncbi:hypothetical protein ACFVYT_41735 [Streptomyces sp. NPDC058290]|uniref:hypothetical protein n=1 Tax=unclassified Streptomyces TaxID=2593676 RepID=UPI0036E49921